MRKFCKEIYSVNNLCTKIIQKILKKIDKEEKKSIIICSGIAELIDTDLIQSRENKGNSFQTLEEINSTQKFFSKLSNNKIKIPEFSFQKRENKTWLVKSSKSLGGNKVFFSNKKNINGNEWYYQKKIVGDVFSVQFFCKENNIEILSVCSIMTRELGKFPFYLYGIITKKLNYKKVKEVSEIVTVTSKLFSLNGFNNIDLIYDKECKKIKVLELNPRPGLSTKMNERKLFKLFKSKLLNTQEFVNPKSFYSSSIIYSKKKFKVGTKHLNFLYKLPKKNFSELPIKFDIIKKNQPVCLLHLHSNNKEILKRKINHWTDNVTQKLYEI